MSVDKSCCRLTCRAYMIKWHRALELIFLLALLLQHEALGAEKPRRQHPLKVLEVSRPPDVGAEICSQVLVQHVFGDTINQAPVRRRYSPRCCSSTGGQRQQQWRRVVLRWTARCTGRQFDRISAVWLGGVEIFRTCTAEPVEHPGIEWTVEKDVTRYSSLWKRPQVVAVELANSLVADSLTGVYDVTLSVHFFAGSGDSSYAAARHSDSFKSPSGETEARTRKFDNPHRATGAWTTKSREFEPSGGAQTKARTKPEFESSGGDTETRKKFEFESASGDAEAEVKKPFAFRSSYDGDDSGSSTGNNPMPAAADVILPFPSSSPDHWFRIHDETNARTQRIPNIPRNGYKAVLEICVSFHGRDEFWYVNRPNAHSTSNNFTDAANENGPFREILVTINDLLAGAVHPFPVFYTSGVNPFFWRPVTAIGSFVLPSYDVDVTPFLVHSALDFSVSVTNALPFWLLGLNLHVWVDTTRVTGALLRHASSTSTPAAPDPNFLTADGTFLLTTSRSLSYAGWLLSSFGNLTTRVGFSARVSHSLSVSGAGSAFTVRQESVTERTVVVESEERALLYDHGVFKFPLRISVHQLPCGREEGAYLQRAAIDHAWEEERQYQSSSSSRGVGDGYGGASFYSSLRNRQQSRGKLLLVPPGEGASRGAATTRQSFAYDDSRGCYFRSVRVGNNGSYLVDRSHTRCT